MAELEKQHTCTVTAGYGDRPICPADFNRLAERSGLRACCLLIIPSATVVGAVSIQLLGEVEACKVVEGMLRGAESTYMGDHGARAVGS